MSTVTIKPGAAGTDDTSLIENTPTVVSGASTSIGIRSLAGSRRHILIRFLDLSAAAGKPIIAASFNWWMAAGGPSGSIVVRVSPVSSSTEIHEDAATWDIQDAPATPWEGDALGDGGPDAGCSIAGIDYDDVIMGTATVPALVPSGTKIEIPITDLVTLRSMINDLGENTGFHLQVTSGSTGVCLFHSSDSATAEFWPELVITLADDDPGDHDMAAPARMLYRRILIQ